MDVKAASAPRKKGWASARTPSPGLAATTRRGSSLASAAYDVAAAGGLLARGSPACGPGAKNSRPGSQQSQRPPSQLGARPISQQGGRPASQQSARPASQQGGRHASQQSARPASQQGGRPASVPLSSSAAGSRKDMRPPLERMLDHRLHSISTFVTSTQSALKDSLLGKSGMSGEQTTQWSEEMPSAVMFPANRLSSRADAIVLNQWITTSLGRYADKISGSQEEEERLSQMVDELVPILSIGLHEVVRQVNQHCLERGVVLEKIWRTYVELFERLLAETRALLRFHKDRTGQVQKELERTQSELQHVKRRHPEQIEKLSKTLLTKFSRRQEELELRLEQVQYDNKVLRQCLDDHDNNVSQWFPRLDKYKNSSLRISLLATPSLIPISTAPEARLAADFKRIITAMPVEGRRRVGFFISSLLGLRNNDPTDETIDGLTEQRDHNAWQIERLENRLDELRSEMITQQLSSKSK